MAEKSIELDSVEIAAAIFGNCDRNIRLLEKRRDNRPGYAISDEKAETLWVIHL